MICLYLTKTSWDEPGGTMYKTNQLSQSRLKQSVITKLGQGQSEANTSRILFKCVEKKSIFASNSGRFLRNLTVSGWRLHLEAQLLIAVCEATFASPLESPLTQLVCKNML